jgi:hypothetical protein
MKKLFVPRAPAVIMPDRGVYAGRRRTRDVAFTYRMGAGFAGDVNRTHPFSVEPCLIDSAAPPTAYGQAVVIAAGTNAVRPVAAGDNALTGIYGVTARPFPTQQMSGGLSSPFGNQVPPTSGIIDVLRLGYILVQMNGTPNKGAPLNVWAAAAAGGDLPGQFTTSTTAGDFIGPLAGSSSFNGPPDVKGIGEIYLAQ